MNSIVRATEKDCDVIASIGKVAVAEAHKKSCSIEIMNEFVETNYNDDAIKNELADRINVYHIIYYNNRPVGFSKINLNAKHTGIALENVTKLDRIYLLKEFHGSKLGYELLKFNIEFSKSNGQSGIWLYTWVGNKRAIDFYIRSGFKIIGSYDFHVAKAHYNLNHHMLLNFSEI